MNPNNFYSGLQGSTTPAVSPPQPQPDQVNTPQTMPSHQPNFFEKLLPTAGGILGGLVSLPLEAANAIAPGVGVGLNVAGATGGSALGKFLENKLTGQAGGNGVLASGAEGAIGQGTGALLGGATKGIMGLLGNTADTAATKMVQGQFNKGALDSGTAQVLRDMGVTNANQVGDIAPHITGSDGALSNGVRRGLTESNNGVDLSGLNQTGQNLVADNQMQLKPGSFKDIGSTIQGALLKATNPEDVSQIITKGNANPVNVFANGALQNVLPENAFNVAKSFETLANSAQKSGFDLAGNVTNPDQAAKYNIFRGLANEAKNAAFGGDTPIPLTPENKAQIINDLEPLKSINPQAHQYITDQVNNAQNLQDLRPLQKPMVDASQALNITQNTADKNGGLTASGAVKTVLPMAGSMVGGTPGMLSGLALSALGTKAADRVGASTLSRASSILTNPTIQNLVKTGASIPTQTIANAPNYVSDQNGSTAGGNMPPQSGVNPYLTTGNPIANSPALLGLQTGLIGLQDPYMASSYAPLVNATIDPLQKAIAANAALQGIERTFNQAGGGQGMVGGLLSRLGGALTGGPTQLYGAQAADLSKKMSDLGIPISSIPQVTNTPEAAQAGFGTIQNIINALGGGGSILAGLPT